MMAGQESSANMLSPHLQLQIIQSELPSYLTVAKKLNMWELLPLDLICIITLYLSVPDFVRFRSVCKSWLRASKMIVTAPGAPHFPWLLLHQNDTTHVSCFNLSENRHYLIPTIIEDANFVGCQNGWLAVVRKNFESCLVNPLTSSVINLPPISAISSSHVNKIIFSLNPTVAVAVCGAYNEYLAFARPADASWILLDTLFDEFNCEDVALHNRRLFAISKLGQLEIFDLAGVSPERLMSSWSGVVNDIDIDIGFADDFFLMSSGSDLLKVRGVRCKNSGDILRFVVMKFDWRVDSCWVEMTNLGMQCLFLSRKHSLSLSVDYVKELKENCIYFISEGETTENSACGMQMYEVENEVIKPAVSPTSSFEGQVQQPLSWFTPSLLCK